MTIATNKANGARCEQAAAEYLKANGFPLAERRHLSGSHDKGDLAGVPQTVVEVKHSKQALVSLWWRETQVEAANAGATYAALWWRPPRRTDPARHVVIVDAEHFDRLRLAQPAAMDVLYPRTGADVVELCDLADHDSAYQQQEGLSDEWATTWASWWPVGVRRVAENAYLISSAEQWASVLRRIVGTTV